MWYYIKDLTPVGFIIFEDDKVVLTEHHELLDKYNLVNIPEEIAAKLRTISVKYRMSMKTTLQLWECGMLKDGGFI